MKRTLDTTFFANDGRHDIQGTVINPGEWFGEVWLLQIAIANTVNPFYAIEANNEQDAIDIFADSERFSYLIDVDDNDAPKTEAEEENSDYTRAGNDGHWVDLSNCSLRKAPANIKYRLEWEPNDHDMSVTVDTLLEVVRKEKAEEEEIE